MDENKRDQIMQNRAERNEIKNKNNRKKDYYTSVTIAQAVICAVLAAVIITISKSGGAASDKLKADFSRLMEWSLENTDSQSVMKSVKDFFSGSESLLPAFSPVEPPETTNEESESNTDNTEQETSQKSEDETAAVTETEPESESVESVGGEDISLYKPVENTSFSPLSTTCSIVPPVESTKYTSYFGYRINPITNERSFHTGLDIAAKQGTKIRAAYAGTVRKTGEDERSGKYIILTHEDGLETCYCHCSKILADEGAVLRQGETVALVGSTGWSTGPHLHFEIRKDSLRLDPLWVLKKDDG